MWEEEGVHHKPGGLWVRSEEHQYGRRGVSTVGQGDLWVGSERHQAGGVCCRSGVRGPMRLGAMGELQFWSEEHQAQQRESCMLGVKDTGLCGGAVALE